MPLGHNMLLALYVSINSPNQHKMCCINFDHHLDEIREKQTTESFRLLNKRKYIIQISQLNKKM